MHILSTFPSAFVVRIIVYNYLICERWKPFLQDFSSDTKEDIFSMWLISMETAYAIAAEIARETKNST